MFGGTQGPPPTKDVNALWSQILREIVIPELTREVNGNKNFAHLRQVYNSLILADWYKKKIKDSILARVYADKNKVAGITNSNLNEKNEIYQRYLRAFKKGVYNFIKEEEDPITQEIIPRKYFSGGVTLLSLRDNSQIVDDQTMNPKTREKLRNALAVGDAKGDYLDLTASIENIDAKTRENRWDWPESRFDSDHNMNKEIYFKMGQSIRAYHEAGLFPFLKMSCKPKIVA